MSSSSSSPSSPSSSSSDSKTITVKIKSLEQKQNISINVPNNLPISEFKKKIEEQLEVPVDRQRIIFRGKVLQDSHRLLDYNLEDGQTVHLVAKKPENEGASSSSSSSQSSSSNSSQQGHSATSPNDLNGILSSVFNSILPGSQSSISIQARQNDPRNTGGARRVVINRRPQQNGSMGETVPGTRILELVNQLRNTFRDQGSNLDRLSALLQHDTWSQEDLRQIQQLARELSPILGNLRNTAGETSEVLNNLHLRDRLTNSHGHREPRTQRQQRQQNQPQSQFQTPQSQSQSNLPISGIQLHVHANSNELDDLPNRLRPFLNDLQNQQDQQQDQQQNTSQQHSINSQTQQSQQPQAQNINLGSPPAGQQGHNIPVGSASITIVSGDDNSNIGEALRSAFQQQQQQQQPNAQQESSTQRSQSSSSSTSQSQSSQSAEFNLSDLASSLLGAAQGSANNGTTDTTPSSSGFDISNLLRTFAGTMSVSQIVESFLGDTQNITTTILRTIFRVLTMEDLISITSGNWASLEKARDPLRNTVENQLLSGDASWTNRKALVQRQLAEIRGNIQNNRRFQEQISQRARPNVNIVNEFLEAIEPHLSLFYELIVKGNDSLDTPYDISSSSSTPFTDCIRLWVRDTLISIIDTLNNCTKNGRSDTEALIRTEAEVLFERAARNNPQMGILSTVGPNYFAGWIMSFYDSNNQRSRQYTTSRSSPSSSSSVASTSSVSVNNTTPSSSSSRSSSQQSTNNSTQSSDDWKSCLNDTEREELESFLSQDTRERQQQSQNQELSEAYRSGSKSGGGGSNQSTIDQQQTAQRSGNNGGGAEQTQQDEADQSLDLD